MCNNQNYISNLTKEIKMTKAEYLLTLLDKTDGLSETVRERFNRELTYTFFGNKKTFTFETLVELVTDPQFARPKHGKQLLIIFKELCKDLETNQVSATSDYIPKPRGGFEWWAIDEDGLACYFERKPKPLSAIFSAPGGTIAKDGSFDRTKYAHMYINDKWKSSLVKVEHKEKNDYIPQFTKEYPFWAIDSGGIAFYYQQLPRQCFDKYLGKGGRLDPNFSSYIYKHMYENEAWKTSLRTIDDL